MRNFRSLTLILFFALAGVLISACGGTTTTRTPPKTATMSTTAVTTPDWSTKGFSIVVASMDLTPGQASTVTAGPYTFQVPVGAFTVPVKFEVLSQTPASWSGKVPGGMKPVLTFALKVTNRNTGQLIGTFDNKIMMIARDPALTAQSMYYNISPNGAVTANTLGLKAKAGELDHPLTGAIFAWVLTTPTGAAGTNTTTTGTSTSGGYGSGY